MSNQSKEYEPPVPAVTLRDRIAEAASKYDGHVTHGSLEAIIRILSDHDQANTKRT